MRKTRWYVAIGTLLIVLYLTYYQHLYPNNDSIKAKITNNYRPAQEDSPTTESYFDPNLQKIVTLNNGLRVLLISDETVLNAAVSCDVHVGSFHEPPSIPGLAHLLEHVVFLGDSLHPNVNTFEEFISLHNGVSNAYTNMEDTNYYYKVTNSYLKESLTRFSSLLFHPLLRKGTVQREYHAIESEFVKDRLEAARRLWRLVRHLARISHPLHRLGAGSFASLNRQDTPQMLKEFHRTYYKPQRVSCAVQANFEMSQLEQMVRAAFESIDKGTSRAVSRKELPFDNDSLGRITRYQLLREGDQLSIIWMVESSKSCGLADVLHILSYRYPRSILSSLRNKGWATALSWSNLAHTTDFTLAKVQITLTQLGVGALETILEMIYYLISTVKHIPASEVEKHLELLYRRKARSGLPATAGKEHHYVKTLSVRLRNTDNSDEVLGKPQLTVYECFRDSVSALTPTTALTLLGSAGVSQPSYTSVEPWFGIPYTMSNISEGLQNRLSHPRNILNIPQIPSVAQVIDANAISQDRLLDPDPDQQIRPTIIMKDEGIAVWWQQDATFRRPRTDIMLLFYRSREHATAAEVAQHLLLVEMIKDQVGELRLQCRVTVKYQSSSGFIIYIESGAHPKLVEENLGRIGKVILDMNLELRDKFEWVVKEQAKASIVKSKYAEAYKHALYKSRLLLETNMYPIEDIVTALNGISLNLFKVFYTRFRLDFGVKAFIYGNVWKSSALKYAALLYHIANRSVSKPNDIPAHMTYEYPKGQYRITASYPNTEEMASVADLSVLLGPSTWNSDEVRTEEPLFTRCIFAQMIAVILHEPIFIELRTKKQLGYSVFVKYVPHFGQDYIHIAIQGSGHTSSTLATAILKFLKSFREELTTIIQNKFKWTEVKSTIRKNIQLGSLSQKEFVIERSAELFSQDTIIDRKDLLISALENMTPKLLLKYYDDYILGLESRKFLLLSQNSYIDDNNDIVEDGFKEINSTLESDDKFLYWHLSYLGIDMGK